MKKTLCVAAALLAVLILGACKSTPKSTGPSAPAGITDPSMPPWINDKPPAGELWGIGVADNAQMNLRMTIADSRARQDLARQLETLARGMVVDYAREAGGINDTAALQFQESVSRQLVDAKLTGADTDVRWNTPDNKTLWVRVKMSKDDAARNAADQILKAVESEAARYAEFKAMDALKMMDQQLEKNHPAPQPVTR
jgi:hypothetical protein